MKELAYLCHKGGVPLINHLIKFVYSLDEDGNKSKHKLDIFKVQEWQYRDIVKIKDPDICKEFKCICQNELEVLWLLEGWRAAITVGTNNGPLTRLSNR